MNLLASLLLSANEPVSYDRMADIVWGNDLPKNPRAALQSLKSRLCRALGGSAILTSASGYRITVEDDALDLLHFERLVCEADSAQGEGSTDRAAALMDRALSLWNLPVLANVHSDILLRERVSFLMERYLSAQTKRASLQLELGRYPVMITELRRLVSAHPFQEDLVRLLMLALYHSHRQADALAAYHHLQRKLRESLGVDPSEPLQRLHLKILRCDFGVGQPGGASRRETLGVDEATMMATRRPACADTRATTASTAGETVHEAKREPRQLPPDTGDFSGRGRELSIIVETFDAARVAQTVVIVGPAGVGKSALAVHAGHLLTDVFVDGQVYLDVAPAGPQPRGQADLLAELLGALGLGPRLLPETLVGRVGLYRSLVAGRRLMLILDNVSTEAQVRDLLPSGAGCGVIVCARPRLAGFPGARLIDLGGLADTEAVALLSQIIGAERLRHEPGSVAALVKFCGGLPLALRTVGARLAAKPHWRLTTLVQRLTDERHRLDELTYGDLNVRAAISASYAALPPTAREMLRKLAAMEALDIPLWAAAALVEGDRAHAEELCEILVDARLLEDGGGPGPQYRMHGLVRAYARHAAVSLQSAPETDAARSQSSLSLPF